MTGSEAERPADLSETFGPAALSGLLSRRAPATAPPAPPDLQPAAAPPEQPAETAPNPAPVGPVAERKPIARPAPERRRPTRAPGGGHHGRPSADDQVETPAAGEHIGDDFTSQVSVYLAADALIAVRRARRETGRTNAEVAFAAIDATHLQLAELVARRRAGEGRADGSLFPVRRASRPAAGAGRRVVLWAMRATPAEVAVLDRLVDEAGATSRSELVASAIEAHLLSGPGTPGTMSDS